MLIVFVTNYFIFFKCSEILTSVFLNLVSKEIMSLKIIKLAEMHFMPVCVRAHHQIYLRNKFLKWLQRKWDASHLKTF